MDTYARRQFLRDSLLAAGAGAIGLAGGPLRSPAVAALPARERGRRTEPIVEHFTGTFDGYIPLLIGNGDMGGTFDPFCGTWFDELRSIPDQEEDVRTLLQARFKVQDYWQETPE